MLKKLLIAFCLLTVAQLPAAIGKDGKAFVKDEITWQPIKFTSKERDIRAQFPGKVTAKDGEKKGKGAFIESKLGKTLYKMDIYQEEIPQEPVVALAIVHAEPNVEGKVLKKHPHKKCTYVIAYERKVKGKVDGVGRVYVTKNAAYNISVQGDDLSLADQIFDSVKIKK